MEIRDFETLYVAGLREARSLEELLVEALPAMADAAADRELAEALRAHFAETKAQLDRLNELLRRYGAAHRSEPDDAVKALVAAADETTRMLDRGALRDAALISAAQRIEHYEIAMYGTLAAHAKMLGRHEEKRILGAILEEERAADEDLSDIADGLVNPHAARMFARPMAASA